MINLTYALATRNKLPYLKLSVDELVRNKQPDDEIIIVDGASTDGTVEYLTELHCAGVIDQFISEVDFGEAHASNKAMLLARGKLIKFVTDDDAIHYPSWQRAKAFMLSHPEIDALGAEGVKRRVDKKYPFSPMVSRGRFELWQRKHHPFASCGLGLMLRTSSLPILGLFDTNFARVDAEYTLRVTASKAKLAWLTLECYAHIRNSGSQSVKQERRITEEMERLEMMYFGETLPRVLKRRARDVIRSLRALYQTSHTTRVALDPTALELEWKELFTSSLQWLDRNSEENQGEFLI